MSEPPLGDDYLYDDELASAPSLCTRRTYSPGMSTHTSCADGGKSERNKI